MRPMLLTQENRYQVTIVHKSKNKTVQHAAAGSPIPTPAVALQPRIPARAMGVPTTKQNTTQITAAAE